MGSILIDLKWSVNKTGGFTLKLRHDLGKGLQEKNTANLFATLFSDTQVTWYGYTSVLHPFLRLSAVAYG